MGRRWWLVAGGWWLWVVAVAEDRPGGTGTGFAASAEPVAVASGTVGATGVVAAATRRGGTTVTVGLPHPERLLQIPAVSLVAEERTLRGSYLGSCVPARDVPRFVELYRAGRLPIDRLLSHRLELEQINEGFDRLASGHALRQVVVF